MCTEKVYYLSDGFSDSLSNWIYRTIEDKDPKDIEAIRSLWDNESWESIQDKLQTEGSTWIVWWYDGVKKYMGRE